MTHLPAFKLRGGLKKSAGVLKILRMGALLTLLMSSLSVFSQKLPFTVQGEIAGLPDGELYLGFGTFGTMKADTVTANNGTFEFKDSIKEPCFAMLFNHDYSVKVDMYLDSGKILVKGNMDSAYNYTVSGSPVVNEYSDYNSRQQISRIPVQQVYEKWMAAYNKGDSAAADQYKAAFEKARLEQSDFSQKLQLSYIQQHPNSIAAAWELLHYIKDSNLDESIGYFNAFSKQVQSSDQGKELSTRIATLSRVQVGHAAPGFGQADTTGKEIHLADYKGKYVLVEFWASWCGPCRAESPNVLNAYSKFHKNGFDVLSVSLDHDKQNWLDAIKKDGLLWQQVSDLKGWKNEVATLYGINAVPANFLVDPKGNIIAQNLRGEALQEALAKVFTAE
ncbi:MAG TPA: redoxin domain-containing protein [Arachidicoccus sp.]|nr:redoxin domain-containing protein [Arachidicoccus sp.]